MASHTMMTGSGPVFWANALWNMQISITCIENLTEVLLQVNNIQWSMLTLL